MVYVFKKIPHEKAVVIGGGTPSHIDYYRNLFRTIPNVQFLGYLPDDEAYSLLASSRLFVFPSYEEGFGLVIGEVMALGIPIVCYDIPALIEVWDNAVHFIKTGNKEALFEEVSTLIKDDNRLNEMSEKGLEYITNFDWQNVVNRETEILWKLCRSVNHENMLG